MCLVRSSPETGCCLVVQAVCKLCVHVLMLPREHLRACVPAHRPRHVSNFKFCMYGAQIRPTSQGPHARSATSSQPLRLLLVWPRCDSLCSLTHILPSFISVLKALEQAQLPRCSPVAYVARDSRDLYRSRSHMLLNNVAHLHVHVLRVHVHVCAAPCLPYSGSDCITRRNGSGCTEAAIRGMHPSCTCGTHVRT